MNDFFYHWFSGFEKGLENLPEQEKSKILCQCGKACSESYSLNVYKNVWARTDNCSDFFGILNDEFKEIEVYEIKKNEEYLICYNECLCDLHTNGYINSGKLCECSRQSLLFNLKSIFANKDIQVELNNSILCGGEKCVFRVKIL